MTKINISIPKPCHEDWHAMTPENKGRFCNSCEKKVHDFTKSSDREIINAFQKDGNLCGRFLNSQLNRDLVKPKQKSTIWLATATSLLSLIGLNEATAQEKAPTEQRYNFPLGKFAVTQPDEEVEVQGTIIDDSGPIPGAMINLMGSEKYATSDFDGNFTIRAKIGDTLTIHFLGYTDKKIFVDQSLENRRTTIELNQDQVLLEGMIATVGGISLKKRTFFGRIFHWIGNVFR